MCGVEYNGLFCILAHHFLFFWLSLAQILCQVISGLGLARGGGVGERVVKVFVLDVSTLANCTRDCRRCIHRTFSTVSASDVVRTRGLFHRTVGGRPDRHSGTLICCRVKHVCRQERGCRGTLRCCARKLGVTPCMLGLQVTHTSLCVHLKGRRGTLLSCDSMLS